MNGRCHNDPMDFADEICDSCGEQFCAGCVVFPRGRKSSPLCTRCAMALSGVRQRAVKPASRSEIRRRRRELQQAIAERGSQPVLEMPGTDLIDGPRFEPDPEDAETGRGILGRFRRRSQDRDLSDVEALPVTAMVGDAVGEPDDGLDQGFETDVDEGNLLDRAVEYGSSDHDESPRQGGLYDATVSEVSSHSGEHASASAILQQLREQEAANDDDVWLPPVAPAAATTWTLPDIDQSPFGAAAGGSAGPWGSLAAGQSGAEPLDGGGADAPAFVSEAELRAQGPADKDQSGNWVPPTLRGIAPEATRDASALPRRRRTVED